MVMLDVAVSDHELGDMWGHAVHHGVGDEDLRKSWGTNRNGWPSASVSPVPVNASSRRLRIAGALTARFSVPALR